MCQRSSRFVLGIEIEQHHADLVRFKPLRQRGDDARFSDAAFAAHGKNDSLLDTYRFAFGVCLRNSTHAV